jgi:hypothetical protein
MRWLLLIAAFWILGGTCASGFAAQPDQIQSWLAQLDAEDFARREEATRQLQAAGDAAIETLAQGALSSSPEVAWRAGEALKQIAIEGNERTLDRVAAALEHISQQKAAGMSKVVAEIRARQRQIRRERATAEIGRLGGSLSGGHGGIIEEGFIGFAMPLVAIDLAEVAPAEAPIEVADEVARVEQAAEEVPDDLPTPPTDDLKAAIEATTAKDVPPPVAAEEVAVLEPAAIDEDVPIALADIGFIEIAGGDALLADGLEDLGGVTQSLTLDANWRGSDKGLAVLRDLPEITQVSIRGAELTDAAIIHLATLPKLNHLYIQGTKFSAAALRKLHRARPKAYLFCQGEAMVGIGGEQTGPCILTRIYPGSGAHDAGLQAGDKVLAIDDLDIRDFSELTISVYARRVGEKLKIEFERSGQRQTAHVELRARKVLEP